MYEDRKLELSKFNSLIMMKDDIIGLEDYPHHSHSNNDSSMDIVECMDSEG